MDRAVTDDVERREFLFALALIAAGPLCSTNAGTAIAQLSAADEASLRSLLFTEAAANKVTAASKEELQHRLGALGFMLANTSLPIADTIPAAVAIADGQHSAVDRNFVPKLRQAFFDSRLATPVRYPFSGLDAGFENLVSGPAALALLVNSLSARSIQSTSEFGDYLRTLATPSDVQRTTRILLGALSQARGSAALTDPAFEQITLVPYPDDASALLDRLPKHSRDLAKAILDVGLTNYVETDQALAQGVRRVLDLARTQQKEVAGAIQRRQQTYNRARTAMHATISDVNSVAAIGSFVLGNVLHDPVRARQFATGMQVATLAFNLALAVGTGGISCLAATAGLVSGLGSLNGSNSQGSSALQEMFSQLSAQVQELRLEMHSRFDRLEAMELESLSLLNEISHAIQHTTFILTDRLSEVQDSILQFEHSFKVGDRKRALNQFSEKIQQAKGAKEDPTTPFHYKRDILSGFLNHAIDAASDWAFVSDRAVPISAAVQKAERLDLAIAQLGKAARLLGIEAAVDFDHNPIEWARGTQAYIEGHASIDVESESLNERAKEAWNIGRALRTNLSNLCSDTNIRKAIRSFNEAATALRDHVVNSAATGIVVGHPPRVGNPPRASLESTSYGISDYESHGSTSVTHYLYQRKDNPAMFFEEWLCLPVAGRMDPIRLAQKAGVISLSEQTPQALMVHGLFGQNAEFSTDIGHQRQVIILNRNNKQIGRVAVLNIDLIKTNWTVNAAHFPQTRLKLQVYDFSPKQGEPATSYREKISSLWSAIYKEFDDGDEIWKWVDGLSVTTPQLSKYNDIAASFALYMAFVNWRITDQLDDPWRSGISSQMLRGIDDLRNELKLLARGMSRAYGSFLYPVPRQSQRRSDTIPQTGHEDTLETLKGYFSGAPEDCAKPWIKRICGSGSADDRERSWTELGGFFYFPLLVDTVLYNQSKRTMEAAGTLIGSLPPPDESVGFVDRALGKLSAFLAVKFG